MKTFLILFLLSVNLIYAQSFVELGINGSGGNSNSINVVGVINFSSDKDSVYKYEVSSKLIYSKSKGTVGNQIYNLNGKLDYKLNGDVELFVFSTYDKNLVRKIKHKINTGVGAKYVVVQNTLDLSLGVLNDYVYYTDKYNKNERLSFRIRNKNLINENISNENIFFYQPDTRDFKAYLNFTSTIQVNINTKLSLNNNFNVLYDSYKIANVKKTDWNFITSIKYKI